MATVDANFVRQVMEMDVSLREARAEVARLKGDNIEGEWIEVHENGKPLWMLHRGAWDVEGRKIAAVKIGDDGKTLWIKIGPPTRTIGGMPL
jgi:SLT domain-containing protein